MFEYYIYIQILNDHQQTVEINSNQQNNKQFTTAKFNFYQWYLSNTV